MRTTIILPTYNEAENIRRLLPELLSLPPEVSVCVVDDNSPDGTGRLADEWAARDARVSVVHRAGKLGLGTAYIAGFKYALAREAEAMLTMDADFSHHPRYIPAMLARAAEADVVIGSRYVPGGYVGYPFHRRALSRTANWVARTAIGLRARDCTAGFRLYRDYTLRSIPLDRIFSNGYSFLVEMLTLIEWRGYRVVEVPIIFNDRQYGQSKISSSEIIRAMYTVARLTARRLKGKSIRFRQQET